VATQYRKLFLSKVGENTMSIREQAKRWMINNFPSNANNTFRVSKYYSDQDIWFFTFPTSYFDPEIFGDLNILLQRELDKNKFHFLKVPFAYFRANNHRFDVRSSGDKIDLHISAKKKNWLICERSNGVSFQDYEQ